MSSRRRKAGTKPKVRKAVRRAGNKGLSRLAIHMVECANIAKMKGEDGKHWTERQFHKQYDDEGRERVEGVIQEIRKAGLWPWR